MGGALGDTYYTILFGLGVSATISNKMQQMFDLKDEEGNMLTGDKDDYLYEYLHGHINQRQLGGVFGLWQHIGKVSSFDVYLPSL